MALTKPPLSLIKVKSTTEKHLTYDHSNPISHTGTKEVTLHTVDSVNEVYTVSGTYDKSTGILTLLNSDGTTVSIDGFLTESDKKPGNKGPKGLDGKDGKDGVDGLDGVRGIQGCPGEKGDQGPQGITGYSGDMGARGPDGEVGPEGDVGQKGVRGFRGEVGDKGPLGLPGQYGPPGPPGEVGIDIKTVTICNDYLVIILQNGKVFKTQLCSVPKPIITSSTQPPLVTTTTTTAAPPASTTAGPATTTTASSNAGCNCVYTTGVWRYVPEIPLDNSAIMSFAASMSTTYGSQTGITPWYDGTYNWDLKLYLLWLLMQVNTKTGSSDRISVTPFTPYYFNTTPYPGYGSNTIMCIQYVGERTATVTTPTDWQNGISPCTAPVSQYTAKPFIWKVTQGDQNPLFFDCFYEPMTAVIVKNKAGEWIGWGKALQGLAQVPGQTSIKQSIHVVNGSYRGCYSTSSSYSAFPMLSGGLAYKGIQRPVATARVGDLCYGSYTSSGTNCVVNYIKTLGAKYDVDPNETAHTIYYDRTGRGPGNIVT